MMNSAFRKTLALLLCAALCAGLLPGAFAEGFTFPDGTVIEDTIAFSEPDAETLTASFPVRAEPELSVEETLVFEVPAGAFIIPRDTTEIGEEAFAGIVDMKSVSIPSGVTKIGVGAFDGCTGLTEIYFQGSGSQWDAISIGARNEALRAAAVILMPSGERWIPVTAACFPSNYFRGYVSSNIDKDKNGWLSAAERNAVTKIDCSGTEAAPVNLQTLKGIEYFPNLVNLYCAYDGLSSLDVSKNTKLEILDCHNNSLLTLDVTKNTKLHWLSVSSNNLSSLDLSNNAALVTLYAHYNRMKTLDVSRNPELANLFVAYNLFTSLDLHLNTNLQNLELLGNSLTGLNLSANTLLQKLYCGKNALTVLDVRSNTLLGTLDCHNNNLTSLDVSRNTALTDLNAAENRLRSLDVSTCTQLERLQCFTNQLTTLTLGSNTRLDRLNCAGNALSELDIRLCPKLLNVYNEITPVLQNGIVFYYVNDDAPYLVLDQATRLITGTTPSPTPGGIPVTSAYFPDNTFRSYVSQNCDTNRDGYLSTSEINAVTSMDLNSKSITSLKGIEYFSSLISLLCNDNILTSLDVSALPSLELLQCYRNTLTSLTLGSNSRLDRLNCAYNNLRQLDIRQCPQLLNVYNTLTPATKDGVISYYRGDAYPYLVLDQATTLITGTTPTGAVPITAAYFPDNVFRSLVSQLGDTNKDGYLSTSEGNQVTVMHLDSRGISTLKGIEYFPRIIKMHCNNNYLTSLDISGLPNLQILECWGNRLSSLSVSNNYYLHQALYNGTRSRVVHGGSYCVRYTYNANVYFECDEGINIY